MKYSLYLFFSTVLLLSSCTTISINKPGKLVGKWRVESISFTSTLSSSTLSTFTGGAFCSGTEQCDRNETMVLAYTGEEGGLLNLNGSGDISLQGNCVGSPIEYSYGAYLLMDVNFNDDGTYKIDYTYDAQCIAEEYSGTFSTGLHLWTIADGKEENSILIFNDFIFPDFSGASISFCSGVEFVSMPEFTTLQVQEYTKDKLTLIANNSQNYVGDNTYESGSCVVLEDIATNSGYSLTLVMTKVD